MGSHFVKALRILIAAACLLAGLFLGTLLVNDAAIAGEAQGLQTALAGSLSSGAISRAELIRLWEPQAPETVPAAVGAAVRLMLMAEDDQVFLPLVRR